MQGTLSISKLAKIFTLSLTLIYCKIDKTTKGQVYQYRILTDLEDALEDLGQF